MPATTMVGAAIRHVGALITESALVAIIVASFAVALSPIFTPAGELADVESANAGRLGYIEVVMAGDPAGTISAGSIFTAWGCDFRPSDPNYFMVVHGPAPDTAELAYWVDAFPVGTAGCGSSTVSWTSSGVPGDFDVWVVRSPSGNPWQARPSSNVVTVTITDP